MLAQTHDRVSEHTDPGVNRHIREQADIRIEYFAQHPEEIPRRLRELEAEWDVERALETGSATLTLLGLVLGRYAHSRWRLLSFAVQGFFLQHALQGWCPPLPVFRRLGFRTPAEICAERNALLSLQATGRRSTAPALSRDGAATTTD